MGSIEVQHREWNLLHYPLPPTTEHTAAAHVHRTRPGAHGRCPRKRNAGFNPAQLRTSRHVADHLVKGAPCWARNQKWSSCVKDFGPTRGMCNVHRWLRTSQTRRALGHGACMGTDSSEHVFARPPGHTLGNPKRCTWCCQCR